MSKLKFIASLFLFGFSSVYAADLTLPVPIQQAFKALDIPLKNVAIFAQSTQQTSPLLSWNADKAMNPASTMKLVTSYAALHLLGTQYTWKTEIYTDGVLDKTGVLQGNLYIKGYGDPQLTLENFWLLLRQLQQNGVRQVTGDLIVDNSYFNYGEGHFGAAEDTEVYNVQPDALLTNLKSIRVMLKSTSTDLLSYAEPSLPMLRIHNQLKISEAACDKTWKNALQSSITEQNGMRSLTLKGSFPRDCSKSYNISLFNHLEYTSGLFRRTFADLGGTLQGQAKRGRLPSAGLTLLASQTSRTAAEILRDINKYSNNVMAQHVFLTIGVNAQVSNPFALDNEKAAEAIQTLLQQKGIDASELVLENGSGLSKNERISAKHLQAILRDMFFSPLYPEFASMLPIVGVDGTMANHLKGTPLAGQAHIKTGSLNEWGVRAVAGYVHLPDGETRIVVAFVNHPNASAASDALDLVLEQVASLPRAK